MIVMQSVIIHRISLLSMQMFVYNYSFSCIVLPRQAAPRRRRRTPAAAPVRARRRRRRHRLHRPGTAAAAGAAPVGPLTRRRRRAPASAARRLPALARLWDGAITPLDPDALAREADIVFLALPDAAAAELAPALVERRRARHRPVGRLPAARRRRARAVVSGNARHARRRRLRPHRARARRGRAARGSSPTRAATRRPRCWPWRRSPTPACSCRAPTSSSTPSRACPAPARRRPSGRISPKCTAACRPTACSTIATAPRSSRGSAGRSRSRRIWCRSIAASWRRFTCACRTGTTEEALGDVYDAGVRRRDVRAAGRHRRCRRSSTSRTRTSATSAGASIRPAAAILVSVHRQPAEGRVGPGRAEHERDARPRRRRRACCEAADRPGRPVSSAASCSSSRDRSRLSSGLVAAMARIAGARAAGHRSWRRQGDRRRAEAPPASRSGRWTAFASPTRRRSTSSSRCWPARSTPVRRGAGRGRRPRGRADRRRRPCGLSESRRRIAAVDGRTWISAASAVPSTPRTSRVLSDAARGAVRAGHRVHRRRPRRPAAERECRHVGRAPGGAARRAAARHRRHDGRRARRWRRDGRRCSTRPPSSGSSASGTATAGMIAKLRACEQALATASARS